MATPAQPSNARPASSPAAAGTVCKTRTDLLDRLARLLVDLGRAKFALAEALENGDRVQRHSAQFDITTLRQDCGRIRVELECHRLQHGC